MASETLFSVRMQTPSIPNFVRLDVPVGSRSQGLVERPTIDVADLTDDQVEAVIAVWAKAFRNNVERRRADRAAAPEGGTDG